MVTAGSAPPRPGGGLPATLLAMMTAIAPAFFALRALLVKLHEPRSINAMLPAMADALVSAEQPSVVDVPALSLGSSASTMLPVVPVAVTAGPNDAAPKSYLPAIDAGALIFSAGVPGAKTAGTSAVTCGPFQASLPVFCVEAARSASVICNQLLPEPRSIRNRS